MDGNDIHAGKNEFLRKEGGEYQLNGVMAKKDEQVFTLDVEFQNSKLFFRNAMEQIY